MQRGVLRRRGQRFSAPSSVVVYPTSVRARRAHIVDWLSTGAQVQDLPRRELDLLLVAADSDSESDLLAVHNLDLPPRIQEAIDRSVRASPLLTRLEATAAYKNAAMQRWLP